MSALKSEKKEAKAQSKSYNLLTPWGLFCHFKIKDPDQDPNDADVSLIYVILSPWQTEDMTNLPPLRISPIGTETDFYEIGYCVLIWSKQRLQFSSLDAKRQHNLHKSKGMS